MVFSTVLDDLGRSLDKITRPELSELLQRLGAEWYDHKQFKRLSPESLKTLDGLANGVIPWAIGNEGTGERT